jgi:putative solute:sodium symporter small subunit
MSKNVWKEYWSKNLRLIITLLIIWFVISYLPALLLGLGVNLNSISFLGFPFGYYMAGQGSLIGFVLLIFLYAKMMNKMDDEYHISDTTERLTQTESKIKIRDN